jgi:hypothetical protein
MNLVLCSQCQRHVRDGDARCPFCGAQARAVPQRSSGALAVALALAAGAGLEGCSVLCERAHIGAFCEERTTPTPRPESSQRDISVTPVYGGPVPLAEAPGVPAYGIAPAPESPRFTGNNNDGGNH